MLIDTSTRQTKIVATLGPSTDGRVFELIRAGATIMRMNCSHGTDDEHLMRAEEVRRAAKRARENIALMLDLQGWKIRTLASTPERIVQVGDVITFAGGNHVGSSDWVGVDYRRFAELVTKQSELVIGDGPLRFAVRSIDEDAVVAEAVVEGELDKRKGVNVIRGRLDLLPARLPRKDLRDLAFGAKIGADIVVMSMGRSPQDVVRMYKHLAAFDPWGPLLGFKLETEEAYERLDEILAVLRYGGLQARSRRPQRSGAGERTRGGIIIGRGDYGVLAGLAAVPEMQRDATERATDQGLFSVAATEMHDSMRHRRSPTRAEGNDVHVSVRQGTSAVMASAETATGDYPVEAVKWMADHSVAAEKRRDWIRGRATLPDGRRCPADAVLRSAVELAVQVGAAALVVPTARGEAARECASYRSGMPIIALADGPNAEQVARQLAIESGVYATTMPTTGSVDELFDSALRTATRFGRLRRGQRVVITAGEQPGVPGATGLTRHCEIP